MGYMELRHEEKKTFQYEPSLQQDKDLVKSFGRELFKGGIEYTNPVHALESLNSPLTVPLLRLSK